MSPASPSDAATGRLGTSLPRSADLHRANQFGNRTDASPTAWPTAAAASNLHTGKQQHRSCCCYYALDIIYNGTRAREVVGIGLPEILLVILVIFNSKVI
jgi:hypothetical protein